MSTTFAPGLQVVVNTSSRCKSIDRTVTKKVCAKNQCATRTTTAKAQNCLMAPSEKPAMTPKMVL